MANKKLSDGVGKKIVEALKKQSEIEITPVSAEQAQADEFLSNLSEEENVVDAFQEEYQQADFLDNLASNEYLSEESDETPVFANEEAASILDESPIQAVQSPAQPFISQSQQSYSTSDSFIKELDTFEIPSNIAVLKKLIAQLPSGVTRQTGAQIIKQTMEALGISMKSVLQEAQQVQDGLSNSGRECHATIQEYKKQILLLEKQAQNYQRQYTALNELISLFIQTGV